MYIIFTQHTFKLCPDVVQNPLLVDAPVREERIVPQFGEHLHERCLSHSSLSLNDHWHTTLSSFMNIQHLDCKVQCQHICRVINGAQTVILVQGNSESTRDVGIQQITRVELPRTRK